MGIELSCGNGSLEFQRDEEGWLYFVTHQITLVPAVCLLVVRGRVSKEKLLDFLPLYQSHGIFLSGLLMRKNCKGRRAPYL